MYRYRGVAIVDLLMIQNSPKYRGVKNLDHLGLVAGIIDEIGIVEIMVLRYLVWFDRGA